MTTNPNIPHVQHAMRKTCIEYQEKIELELDKMIQQVIITPVTDPFRWVNSITYPGKPSGELCICLDPRDLNTAIVREQYKAPTLEETTHKFSGTKKFSKLDAYKRFFAYHLKKESSMKTTFNTTPCHGSFHFFRIPIGTKFSQDAYQMKMDQIPEGLEGVMALHDDITLYGKDDADHDKNLIALMERAQQKGLTFNSKK